MTVVTAIFDTQLEARDALARLETLGIPDRNISLIMTDEARGTHFRIKTSSKVDEGAAAGAGIGGIVGAILGAVLSAGVIAIPGLNLVVVGALASSLAGLGAGAVVGGLGGALIGAGIPEHEAKIYEKEVQKGNILLAVKAENNEQRKQLKDLFETLNARSIAA